MNKMPLISHVSYPRFLRVTGERPSSLHNIQICIHCLASEATSYNSHNDSLILWHQTLLIDYLQLYKTHPNYTLQELYLSFIYSRLQFWSRYLSFNSTSNLKSGQILFLLMKLQSKFHSNGNCQFWPVALSFGTTFKTPTLQHNDII